MQSKRRASGWIIAGVGVLLLLVGCLLPWKSWSSEHEVEEIFSFGLSFIFLCFLVIVGLILRDSRVLLISGFGGALLLICYAIWRTSSIFTHSLFMGKWAHLPIYHDEELLQFPSAGFYITLFGCLLTAIGGLLTLQKKSFYHHVGEGIIGIFMAMAFYHVYVNNTSPSILKDPGFEFPSIGYWVFLCGCVFTLVGGLYAVIKLEILRSRSSKSQKAKSLFLSMFGAGSVFLLVFMTGMFLLFPYHGILFDYAVYSFNFKVFTRAVISILISLIWIIPFIVGIHYYRLKRKKCRGPVTRRHLVDAGIILVCCAIFFLVEGCVLIHCEIACDTIIIWRIPIETIIYGIALFYLGAFFITLFREMKNSTACLTSKTVKTQRR